MTRHGPPAVRLVDCRSLVVTAWFAESATIAVDSYWPAVLDGILGGALVAQGRVRPTDIAPLPLARHGKGAAGQWSWSASVGTPLGLMAETAGGWGSRWERDPAPEPLTCVGMEWRAVGVADEVRVLLAHVAYVGNRDHQGPVDRWIVADAGDPDLGHTTWLPSGYIARPFAARVAGVIGLFDEHETVDGALRPPYWRPPPTNADGAFNRQWRPVIAPWTLRP